MPGIPKSLGDGFESRPDRPQMLWGLKVKNIVYMAVDLENLGSINYLSFFCFLGRLLILLHYQ